MKQTYGNIGILNLIEATEKSIEKIEQIHNVGVLLYSKETAPLVPSLNIHNLGESLCTEKNTRLITGTFTVDASFLRAITEPTTVLVTGVAVFATDITETILSETKCRLIIVGVTFTPDHLKGYVNLVIEKNTGIMTGYKGVEPTTRLGDVELTNGLLQSLPNQHTLVINGYLTVAQDLDLELFSNKIDSLIINGGFLLYKDQEVALTAKTTLNGKQSVISTGYTPIKSTVQLTNRSIRRFKAKSIHTTKPIILHNDITREALSSAFQAIDSSSYIICHEDVEDLIYETIDHIETEVYTYSNHLKYIEDEEWGEEELKAIQSETMIVVARTLKLRDVPMELIQDKNVQIMLLGELQVPNATTKSTIRSSITVNAGVIVDLSEKNEDQSLANMGQLTL